MLYLQVFAANQAAMALYRSAGFERGYTYHYRRLP
jgi:ribosomal protein S18 acetylase RimI-like enzyme